MADPSLIVVTLAIVYLIPMASLPRTSGSGEERLPFVPLSLIDRFRKGDNITNALIFTLYFASQIH